jgi:alpha-N-acetylglucosaminidase
MVWWNFTQWEPLIDWFVEKQICLHLSRMALNGVNMPLAFTGQEFVWQQVYQLLGLSNEDLSDFFSSPAFLPWQRMGNLDGWLGPLNQTWIATHHDLQLKILKRQREFGMSPVLPGFAGSARVSFS